jgi:hypothetical protein
MLGKILPYLGVGLVQVALVLTLGVLLFDVPIRGSLIDLALGTTPFLAAMLAMGLVISAAPLEVLGTELAAIGAFFAVALLVAIATFRKRLRVGVWGFRTRSAPAGLDMGRRVLEYMEAPSSAHPRGSQETP